MLYFARLRDRPSEPDSLLLHIDDVVRLVGGGISRRSIWRLLKQGDFPPSIRAGGRTAWRRADIDLWVEAGCDMALWQRLKRR